MHRERPLAACERLAEVSLGGLEQGTAARAHRERPGRAEPAAGFLEPAELDPGLVEVADRDQRLDRKLPSRVESSARPHHDACRRRTTGPSNSAAAR